MVDEGIAAKGCRTLPNIRVSRNPSSFPFCQREMGKRADRQPDQKKRKNCCLSSVRPEKRRTRATPEQHPLKHNGKREVKEVVKSTAAGTRTFQCGSATEGGGETTSRNRDRGAKRPLERETAFADRVRREAEENSKRLWRKGRGNF